MHHFGRLKSHQQEEGNWDTIFKDSAIYSRCVKCCIFSLLFPVSLVWSSWLCGLETPGQLCFVSWGCGGRSSSITVKLTVNRFCMNANKALKLGAKTAEDGRWGEKILVYLSRWHYHNFSSFVICFYWCRHHRKIDILNVIQVACGTLLTHFRNDLSLTLSVLFQSRGCLQASTLLAHLKYGHSLHPATPFNLISTPSFCVCFPPFEWWQRVRKSGFVRVLS